MIKKINDFIRFKSFLIVNKRLYQLKNKNNNKKNKKRLITFINDSERFFLEDMNDASGT